MSRKRNKYSAELKLQAVQDYLAGKGSLRKICKKYGIPDHKMLRQWISCYNGHKDYRRRTGAKGEIYMTKGRKTTQEERKEIVEYCITHGKDYKGTAVLYKVSYNQVYMWVKKYLSDGEEGLKDNRGHHKTDDEVDELERIRRENLRLKRQLEERDMVVELLKKVKEFEGV